MANIVAQAMNYKIYYTERTTFLSIWSLHKRACHLDTLVRTPKKLLFRNITMKSTSEGDSDSRPSNRDLDIFLFIRGEDYCVKFYSPETYLQDSFHDWRTSAILQRHDVFPLLTFEAVLQVPLIHSKLHCRRYRLLLRHHYPPNFVGRAMIQYVSDLSAKHGNK